MLNLRTATLALMLLLTCLAGPAMAGERGFFGFAPAVSMDGFSLNPTVKSVSIGAVIPDTPAARAGIVAGDLVVEIEGMPVVGQKAFRLAKLSRREVGEPLRALLQRADGQRYEVTLVAIAKP